ncbi:unnamed protein product [Strongylus vulgaris]|uniref:Glycosyltransferase family 92 protein n=1 Tax=Strongylus vulgaris TaxID=40348 RepID=A0A3P7IPE2_STRVU|nr:unnamed protein product [Strongylus vulgaris]
MSRSDIVAEIRFSIQWVLRTTRLPSTYEGREGEETLRKHLPTLIFHNTSGIGSPKLRPKCVVDSRHVLLMAVHRVAIYFPGYTGIDAPVEKALVRHYRDLEDHLVANYADWLLPRLREKTGGEFTLTYYPANLMRQLYSNVKQRLQRVYGKI